MSNPNDSNGKPNGNGHAIHPEPTVMSPLEKLLGALEEIGARCLALTGERGVFNIGIATDDPMVVEALALELPLFDGEGGFQLPLRRVLVPRGEFQFIRRPKLPAPFPAAPFPMTRG